MQLEEAKEICKSFVEENKDRPIILHTAIETVLQVLDSSIPIQVIEEKIEENKGYLEHANTAYEYTQREVIEEVIKGLQELLAGK